VIYQVAIDGPAASGKSTTARAVARDLRILHLDTGAMYRAFTLRVLEAGADPTDAGAVAALLPGLDLAIHAGSIHLGGRDVSGLIRENRVSTHMGPVCAMPAVRRHLVELQRAIGSVSSCVIDGRDIGTVVFPGARFKFFLVADLGERARRRHRELLARGEDLPLEQLEREIRLRDESDASRATGPLKQAADAQRIDTTHLGPEEQVALIVRYVRTGLSADTNRS
jgi:CMP/dCMP kinase